MHIVSDTQKKIKKQENIIPLSHFYPMNENKEKFY